MCILHIVFCTVCKYVLSICKLLCFFVFVTCYVPKVPIMPYRDQVVNLQALPLEEADPALALLCPVCAL